MDKADWKYMEEALDKYVRPVSLICDSYKVTFILKRTSKRQLGIFTYVNGWFRGEWILNDCEERRRFYCRSSTYLHSKEFRKKLKGIRKKTLKGLNFNPDVKTDSYSPIWNSFRSLKRHLMANNKDIQLVKD